jgi:hypothetical protein
MRPLGRHHGGRERVVAFHEEWIACGCCEAITAVDACLVEGGVGQFGVAAREEGDRLERGLALGIGAGVLGAKVREVGAGGDDVDYAGPGAFAGLGVEEGLRVGGGLVGWRRGSENDDLLLHYLDLSCQGGNCLGD